MFKIIDKHIQSIRALCYVLFISIISQGLVSCAGGKFLGTGRGTKYSYKHRMVAPAQNSNLMWQDEIVRVQFKIDQSAILFQLQNLSPSGVNILWNKASIGIDGRIFPVRNTVNYYSDTVLAVQSPIIPRLGYVQEMCIPAQNIRSDGYRWVEEDLLPTVDKSGTGRSIMRNIGKSITFILPLKIGNSEKDYLFAFKVDTIRQVSWKDYQPPKRNPPPIPNKSKMPSTNEISTAIVIVGVLGFVAFLISLNKAPLSE
jgi:hypothetical protein